MSRSCRLEEAFGLKRNAILKVDKGFSRLGAMSCDKVSTRGEAKFS